MALLGVLILAIIPMIRYFLRATPADLLASFQGTNEKAVEVILLSGFVGFPLLALWFVTALFLGKSFRKAIKEKKVVC